MKGVQEYWQDNQRTAEEWRTPGRAWEEMDGGQRKGTFIYSMILFENCIDGEMSDYCVKIKYEINQKIIKLKRQSLYHLYAESEKVELKEI